jgi:hypothetical protein
MYPPPVAWDVPVPTITVAEIHRVLRPGGLLIATVPNIGFWRRRVDRFGRWNAGGDDLGA